jgi:hypothetical protein
MCDARGYENAQQDVSQNYAHTGLDGRLFVLLVLNKFLNIYC